MTNHNTYNNYILTRILAHRMIYKGIVRTIFGAKVDALIIISRF